MQNNDLIANACKHLLYLIIAINPFSATRKIFIQLEMQVLSMQWNH